jgi:ssRNA-specific RNase YbeY (16S rRNA maturation enzyme)
MADLICGNCAIAQASEYNCSQTFLHRHAQISTAVLRNNTCEHFTLLLLCVQIDRKENFANQFRDGDKGKTELASFELNEKRKLRNSIPIGDKGKTKLAGAD